MYKVFRSSELLGAFIYICIAYITLIYKHDSHTIMNNNFLQQISTFGIQKM